MKRQPKTKEEKIIIENQMKCMLCMSDTPSSIYDAGPVYKGICMSEPERCNAVGPGAQSIEAASKAWDDMMKMVLEIRAMGMFSEIR